MNEATAPNSTTPSIEEHDGSFTEKNLAVKHATQGGMLARGMGSCTWKTCLVWAFAAMAGGWLATCLPVQALRAESTPAKAPKLYELRTYTTLPGRLDALNKRFRDHTTKLFAKHGMTNVIYLTPVKSENTLVYLIAHENEAAAAASWKAFREDPEWKVAREASEADGKIVEKVESVYLTPTDYSAMK